MKKLILTILVGSVAMLSQAQMTKGNMYLGGSVGFSSNKYIENYDTSNTEDNKGMNWNFSPEFGYFISDDMSVGLTLMLGGSSFTDNKPGTGIKSDETKGSNFGVALNARKYFSAADNFSLFLGANLEIGSGKSDRTITPNTGSNNVNTTEYSLTALNLNAGLMFNITPKVMIFGQWAPGLGWSKQKTTYSNSSGPQKTEQESTQIGLNINTVGTPFNLGMFFVL